MCIRASRHHPLCMFDALHGCRGRRLEQAHQLAGTRFLEGREDPLDRLESGPRIGGHSAGRRKKMTIEGVETPPLRCGTSEITDGLAAT